MKVYRIEVPDNTVPLGDIPAHRAFEWGGDLCMLIDEADKPGNVKNLEEGNIFRLFAEARVVPKPDAEIHIGPHPAIRKVEQAKEALQGLLCEPDNWDEDRIEAVIKSLENDDEQD